MIRASRPRPVSWWGLGRVSRTSEIYRPVRRGNFTALGYPCGADCPHSESPPCPPKYGNAVETGRRKSSLRDRGLDAANAPYVRAEDLPRPITIGAECVANFRGACRRRGIQIDIVGSSATVYIYLNLTPLCQAPSPITFFATRACGCAGGRVVVGGWGIWGFRKAVIRLYEFLQNLRYRDPASLQSGAGKPRASEASWRPMPQAYKIPLGRRRLRRPTFPAPRAQFRKELRIFVGRSIFNRN